MDRWLGRGEASITTPPMDGAFRPNDLLDAAASVLETPAPDGSGHHVAGPARFLRALAAPRRHDRETRRPLPSTQRSARSPDCRTAARRSALSTAASSSSAASTTGRRSRPMPEVRCITALAAAADGALLVANGSATHGPADWKRDLMEKNASGLGVAARTGERRVDATCGQISPTRTACSTRATRSSFPRAGAAR